MYGLQFLLVLTEYGHGPTERKHMSMFGYSLGKDGSSSVIVVEM